MKATKTRLLGVFILLSACGSPKYQDGYSNSETSIRNRSRVRNFELFVENQFYYQSDTETSLFYKLNPTDFFPGELSEDTDAYHRVLIELGIYTSPSKRRPLSEQQQLIEFGKDSVVHGEIVAYHPVMDCWYEFTISDLNRKTKTTHEGWLYKEKKPTEFNFLLRNASTSDPILNRYTSAQAVEVECRRCNSGFLSLLRYDQLQFNAPPAFITEGYLPNFGAMKAMDTLYLREGKGIFQIDSAETILVGTQFIPFGSVAVFHVGERFPGFNNVAELLPCLKYICSKEEYQGLLHAEDKLAAFDYFWLKIARDKPELAQDLAKQYFARVSHCNRHFNSYKPGWMTDRGMIYIVFGPPDHIDRAGNTETWIYGVPYQFNSLNLIFDQEANFTHSNNYTLRRYDYLRVYWHQTVEQWRSGFVQGP
jgi:GWxTD domain-containing protein